MTRWPHEQPQMEVKDLFLYRGMRVRLTGKIGSQWRVRFSGTQSGWVKDSAIQELPRGSGAPQAVVSNINITSYGESSLIRVPMSDVVPYRVEQTLESPTLIITLSGAVDKTDLIRYDPYDPLIQLVRWKQLSPEVCQLIIEPKFKTWWGFDVRYEGSTMVIEVRKPWVGDSIHGMKIAIDPGHGGSDKRRKVDRMPGLRKRSISPSPSSSRISWKRPGPNHS